MQSAWRACCLQVPARGERSAPRAVGGGHAPSSIPISISARRRDLYDSRRRFFHGGGEIFVSTLSCPHLIQPIPSRCPYYDFMIHQPGECLLQFVTVE